MNDYFAALEIDRHLAIDTKDLERRFYALSRKRHPDAGGSDAAMAELNDAWRTLRDPVTRALYVLKQEGYDIAEQKDIPPELLEEVFELNEALESGAGASACQPFERLKEEIDAQLNLQFAAWDQGEPPAVLHQIRALINRRKYITNLIKRATEHVPNRI